MMSEPKADDTERGAHQSNFGVLELRVDVIQKFVEKLELRLADIQKAIIESSKTKWPVIIGFATLILFVSGGLWKMAIDPISADIYRLYSLQDKLSLKLDDELKILEARQGKVEAEFNAKIMELDHKLRKQ